MPTHDIFKPVAEAALGKDSRERSEPVDGFTPLSSEPMPVDIVNRPDHYCQNGMEAIDVMQAFSDREEFVGHLRLTCIKYLLRMNTKDTPEVNVRKAKWYLDRLVREVSE